jgi:hypothetical protein
MLLRASSGFWEEKRVLRLASELIVAPKAGATYAEASLRMTEFSLSVRFVVMLAGGLDRAGRDEP